MQERESLDACAKSKRRGSLRFDESGLLIYIVMHNIQIFMPQLQRHYKNRHLYVGNVTNQAFFLFLSSKPKMQLQSCDIKHSSSTEENPHLRTSQKKYVKITEQVKQTFLKFIIESNMSIKKASEALRINYSSAKAILSAHKKTLRINKCETSKFPETTPRSSYKTMCLTNQSKSQKLSLCCSVGGKSTMVYVGKTKVIFKPEILIPVRQSLE